MVVKSTLSLDVAAEALEHSALLPSNPVDLEVIDLPAVGLAPASAHSAPAQRGMPFQKAGQESGNRQQERNESDDR